MEKPENPELKITSRQNCNFILNFYRSLTSEEIIQKETYYAKKIEHLRNMNTPEEIIWKYKDRLNLLIYEEERRTYDELVKNISDYENIDNNLDQFDTENWFNDDD